MALSNIRASFTLLDGGRRERDLVEFGKRRWYPSFLVHQFNSPLHEDRRTLVAVAEWSNLSTWSRAEGCVRELKAKLEAEPEFFVERLKVSSVIPDTRFSPVRVHGRDPLYLLATQILVLPESRTPELLEICRRNGLFVVHDSLSIWERERNRAWHLSKRFESEGGVSRARSSFIAIVAELTSLGVKMPRDLRLECVLEDSDPEKDDELIVPCDFTAPR